MGPQVLLQFRLERIQLIHHILLRSFPSTRIFSKQRLLISLPNNGAGAIIMRFDFDPDWVTVYTFWRDVAGGEYLLDARDGGVAFLPPPISVAAVGH
mmetsp:Transcript_7127/g.12598  ORF Transcript_7127/g.12598 Transcript_7127/m.12598 type:complete len:97 (-) Transcript_7127:212-502(-)